MNSMSFTITRPVFAHFLQSPPREDAGCDITLELINPSGAITLSKEATGIQTKYLLIVSDPSKIWLSTSEQVSIERAVKNLVLAFNLYLVRTCLSTLRGDLPSPEVEFKPPQTKVKIEQTSNEKHTLFVDDIIMRDTLYFTLGTHEELDEEQALSKLEKIVGVNRFDLKSTTSLRLMNLVKALNEYENAMTTFDRLLIFKNLFNTLEFCSNWNGVDRTGSALDSVIASISNVQQNIVESWRQFYNRTKHVDRTPINASQFVQGMERLSSILPSIREAAKLLIIDRLNRI